MPSPLALKHDEHNHTAKHGALANQPQTNLGCTDEKDKYGRISNNCTLTESENNERSEVSNTIAWTIKGGSFRPSDAAADAAAVPP